MLYVINAIGTDYYKIGFSTADPERRLEDLQTGSPFDLKTILLIDGDRADEAKIHNFLKQRGVHVRSEWFEIKQFHLFELMLEWGLGRQIKSRPVSMLSSKAAAKSIEDEMLEDWLVKHWTYEKSSSFASDLGTPFEELFNSYFLYCKKFASNPVDAAKFSKSLDSKQIGRKLDKTGVYVYNIRQR